MKIAARDQLKAAIGKSSLPTNFVFHIDTLAHAKGHSDCIALSTTHRAFVASSKYGECYSSTGTLCLHFLDPKSVTLTTYRGLGRVHPPQVYRGVRLVSKLADVRVSPRTGEFVHPGEVEAPKQPRAQPLARELAPAVRPRADVRPSSQAVPLMAPEATCTLCGQITRDYWKYDERDKTCRCRECRKAGRY